MHYISPEIFEDNQYGPPADMWALGVIMYIMLFGLFPFSGEEISHSIIKDKLIFKGQNSSNVSSQAKQLLHEMMNKNRLFRISAADALNHDWFKNLTPTVANADTVAKSKEPSTV
mmetsp:Transcript_43299/g.31197  ORF Transcript_43299/g.31197 Transcript_43299/m.31197 type:complete len:115 (-) Transcript_43299:261-605(-)